jgi:hypothetical protein
MVALVQEHRGHGVSTAAYHLSRALAAEGLRVLVVDLTGRRTRLQTILTRRPLKNVALWAPPLPKPGDLRQLLAQARCQTAGRVDLLLLDADASLVEHAGGLAMGIDYAVVVTAATLEGQHAADRIAERLGDVPPPYGKVGVVFSRVSASEAGDLKEQTENRKTPVIGHYPADYLLAAGDEYSLTGAEPSEPHERYVVAMGRLARMLMRRVPLRRLTSATPTKPAESKLVDAAVATARIPGARIADAPVRPVRDTPVAPETTSGIEPHVGV